MDRVKKFLIGDDWRSTVGYVSAATFLIWLYLSIHGG